VNSLDAGIVIVGAGPAGMAAACAASGHRVIVIDDNPAAGGQIWRGRHRKGRAYRWLQRFHEAGAKLMGTSRVIGLGETSRSLVVEQADGAVTIAYDRLIIATGARELFLPFPGWTLPNVVGVGGLQALVKSGAPMEGKRVVIAGSGPLLLAVAASLRGRGAHISLIAEQASFKAIAGFAARLAAFPRKLREALRLECQLLAVPYKTGAWVEAAHGNRRVASASIVSGGERWLETCDYLAVAYGLTPNLEIPMLLGCEIRDGRVVVDSLQRTTVPDVYCAGEPTGIGGVETSLLEGEIAGACAAGRADSVSGPMARRDRWRTFASALNHAFALRPELRSLAKPDTLICRCEDVTAGRLAAHQTWRSAKLHTRCGMGPCQGRICGPALEFLRGWRVDSVRPPLFPARVGSLAHLNKETNQPQNGVLA
jgi:NADPH-dependent 2,4-dienoyl-CoA reductase/sulfur reductase-like enzyme